MASYYVSTNGSDNNSGQLDKPFASLQHAHDIAKPGDTIYMRGGVYKLTSEVRLTNDGTSGNPITVTNYQNEVPILDGSSMKGGYVVDMSSVSWNHIKGLEIKNGPEGGLMIQGQSHNNKIEQLDVHHNGWNSEWEGKGIVMFGASSNNLLLNNDSHHNQDLHRDNADGFQVSTTGTGNVLRGNRAWANSDDGFDFFNVHNNTKGAPLVLDGNWAFDNGYALDGSVGGDGNGFKLGGARAGTDSTSGGHIVTNNVAWGNRSIGFDENSASNPIKLEHNTAYNNGLYNYGFWETEHTFRNNLSAGTGKIAASGSTEGNSWTMPVKVDSSDFQSLNDSTARGDRGADGSLPSTQFLHLAKGSDLVNLGAFGTGTPPTDVTPPDVTPPDVTPPDGDVPGSVGLPDYDSYKMIDGNGRANTINGTSGAELIDGKGGNDKLFGHGGNDLLEGGNGADQLSGGAGNDFLDGGQGADVFVYREANWGTDVILDWEDGSDKIDLRQTGLKFTDLGVVGADVDGDGQKDDVFITSDHGNIGLLDTNAAAINASDFLL
ncbi:right-handed parallel beta-helix repeat-containing protein [Rhizobium sp. ARZ01]|uniref:calcium-binding protein n=1 Tax=Rhizobium sp. ARZ01 TaxID=2769313 RepID=UPI001783B89E|nr:right-handed parallel beta-helix repeat-containing protein [Rhizobium sp. ARZ01]MBD9375249.1 right-handed parallel beta-helix repeat-containing protein [Rhizobium sp. ARZ01]